MTIFVVETTVDTYEQAQKIAHAVVNARLAACVQMHKIESVYHWQGRIEQADEYILRMKTPAKLVGLAMNLIGEHHSYDTPEIIAYPLKRINPDYRTWVINECRPAS